MQSNDTDVWTPFVTASVSFFSVVGAMYLSMGMYSITTMLRDLREGKWRVGCFSEVFLLIFLLCICRSGNFVVVIFIALPGAVVQRFVFFLDFVFVTLSPVAFYAIFCRLVFYWAWVCRAAEGGVKENIRSRYRSLLTLYYGISGCFVVIVSLIWASVSFLPQSDDGGAGEGVSNVTRAVENVLNITTDVFCGAIAFILVIGCAVYGRKSYLHLTSVQQSQLRKANKSVTYTAGSFSSLQPKYNEQQLKASAKLVGRIRTLGTVSAVAFALRACVDFAMMSHNVQMLIFEHDLVLIYFSVFSILFELLPMSIVAVYFTTTKRLKRNPSFPKEKLSVDSNRFSRVTSSVGYLPLQE